MCLWVLAKASFLVRIQLYEVSDGGKSHKERADYFGLLLCTRKMVNLWILIAFCIINNVVFVLPVFGSDGVTWKPVIEMVIDRRDA